MKGRDCGRHPGVRGAPGRGLDGCEGRGCGPGPALGRDAGGRQRLAGRHHTRVSGRDAVDAWWRVVRLEHDTATVAVAQQGCQLSRVVDAPLADGHEGTEAGDARAEVLEVHVREALDRDV